MSLVSDFMDEQDTINQAIKTALEKMAKELLELVKKYAESEVYSYEATPQAMANRRGKIGDAENFLIEYDENSVTLTNVTRMQGTDYGVPEAEFVQEGYENYNQPGPREFMHKALHEYLSSGKADATFNDVMAMYNLDVTGTITGE